MSLSPSTLRYECWWAEARRLQNYLDTLPFCRALTELEKYHILTGYSQDNQEDFRPYRVWRSDRRLSLVAHFVQNRNDRLTVKARRAPPEGVVPVAGGCPLAVENLYWQQTADQFPYTRTHNRKPFNYLVQYRPFGKKHFTVASARHEPQDWRPSLDRLHQRVLDLHSIAVQSGLLILRNGSGAAASLDWDHAQALLAPEGAALPIQQAIRLAAPGDEAVARLNAPYWPLPAFRIKGPADVIAGEVCALAERCSKAGGEHASESIAMYSGNGAVTCIYVPRDRRREYCEQFRGKLGAFETAAGCLVFSDPEPGIRLLEGRLGFEELWSMLSHARPEWSDDL